MLIPELGIPASSLMIDLAILMAYFIVMKVANTADFKNRISEYLSAVEKGEEVEVRRRNVPIARVVPIKKSLPNATALGCGRGTGRILADPTLPFIAEEDWAMLEEPGK
jgi:prevent-host-death family protein